MKSRAAFSLVEVTLAIGIVAFAVLALFALIPVGMNTVKDSSDETIATNTLFALASDLRNIQSGKKNSPLYGIPVWDSAAATTGSFYLGLNGEKSTTERNYVVFWTAYRAASSTTPAQVHLEVAWPGAATNPSNMVETVVSLLPPTP